MADIALRFHKDMLVLSSPIASALARRGVNVETDLEFITLIEPETIHDILRLEKVAGAQILVTNTEGITQARLTHHNMEDRVEELAKASLEMTAEMKPQHILFEIGPCNLPLDASSKPSLVENRDQYARVARAVKDFAFDAYYLRGFTSTSALKCALMGIRKVDDRPIFAQVIVDENGMLNPREDLERALVCAREFGAQVAGFATKAGIEAATRLAKRAVEVSDLPLIVELVVVAHNPKQGEMTKDNPYYCPDIMVQAAAALRNAGAQFLRAAGQATPAYTGVLAATVSGFDAVRPDCQLDD
ncbi:MAG: homocysteine S-methyltransferase family protein [Eggerthellaceae bacterium]|nr:homocysteine S-methyltransferase family protein [Eggerthellaceae bacterium]